MSSPSSEDRASSVASDFSDESNASEPEGPHEWSAFEIRVLVTLIMKGEHNRFKGNSQGLADRFNAAMNPNPEGNEARAKQRKKDGSKFKVKLYRNVPADEVQAMLDRIMDKKKVAVNFSDQDLSPALTRRKMRLFSRGDLDFTGTEEEWKEGRKRKAESRRGVMYQKMMMDEAGKETYAEREERYRRRNMVRSGNPKALLKHWRIGTKFWEDSDEDFYMKIDDFKPAPTNTGPKKLAAQAPLWTISDSRLTGHGGATPLTWNSAPPASDSASGYLGWTAPTPAHHSSHDNILDTPSFNNYYGSGAYGSGYTYGAGYDAPAAGHTHTPVYHGYGGYGTAPTPAPATRPAAAPPSYVVPGSAPPDHLHLQKIIDNVVKAQLAGGQHRKQH